MFSQLFGNYLLRKEVVTPEQLIDAMSTASHSRMKLGTMCIHEGLMTSAEVEKVYILQTHQDKRFGEIAVEEGYLSEETINRLLSKQSPDYLLLAQALIDNGILSHEEAEKLLYDYQTETELYDLDITDDHMDRFEKLVSNFCSVNNMDENEVLQVYLKLLFNNMIRFIGDDFTPMNIIPFSEYATSYCAAQNITGQYPISSALDMNETTAIAFASRYAGEDFEEIDEFVIASLEDFLNLHNGLFVVNLSNTNSVELNLEPPETIQNDLYAPDGLTYLLPIHYSFGTINFIITI